MTTIKLNINEYYEHLLNIGVDTKEAQSIVRAALKCPEWQPEVTNKTLEELK